MTDILSNPPKVDWADEFDVSTPVIEEDKDVKVIVEYKTNDLGKKVKVTRRIRMHMVQERVHKAAALRKQWEKFGDEKGKPPGPDVTTTVIGEKVFLKLSTTGAAAEEEADDEEKKRQDMKGKKILCRICKGGHFTSKCPYKDTLKPLDELESTVKPSAGSAAAAAAAGGDGKSSYVPPHMRAGADTSRAGGMDGAERDRRDENTLRVTNLSEDVQDDDVRELFRSFGPISRIYVSKDRDTGLCRGFAFVTFLGRSDAQRALEAINGYGYDNLILCVEWAK
ncbi:eukaryotic translation initiation factor 3 subunit G-domain-containing protein [Syncephalis pseudoplumigaleata]|uniref:Eukaryotic translation initiation factor 3 subunit G n=1 Tax=Syncephalis pseudoplumigaleata TaxID=1712513 RepID=A0A4P9Z6S4_9FUNG|nr:eukaryotic translation initiation factor 3 subunit G-domain-containing protein [Syncephalis pseudoplumigaleata]|eukprot:RKP28158.1 eukaryotic translation initiation factor 3 subunit G-domain-containing protein [Syncephalis pseudoplumigaleata]